MWIVLCNRAVPDILANKSDYHPIVCCASTDLTRHATNPQHYRKTSSISRTKSHNLNVSNLVLQLSLFNPLKPGVKSRMKM